MNTTQSRLFQALDAHKQSLATLLAVILLINTFLVARHAFQSDAGSGGQSFAADGEGSLVDEGPGIGVTPGPSKSATAKRAGPSATPTTIATAPPGTFIPGKGTVPLGVDFRNKTIKVIYYWKANETMTSQFLAGTGQEGNVDESLAFINLMKWINKHANDGSELMGYKFDLHDWRFVFEVKNAGKADDQQRAAVWIRDEAKPFAAVSSHGSVSAVVCPVISKAKIFNISTYDLDWGLTERTNGFCMPQGLSWGAQVDLSIPYLKKQNDTTTYSGTLGPEERRYGLLYAEYDDLMRSGPVLERKLKAAGINLVATATVDDDLTTAARQQSTVIDKFRGKEVNTIIAPDSGSLITFTHASAGAQYHPDYFIWPCSGADSLGMVRLYDADQWSRARGLSCYDKHLNADLTNDDIARQTEWYKAYQEMAGSNAEPPAPTALVYQSLLPLLAGITHAGDDLTIERFKQGLSLVKPYRYDAITGRNAKPTNILVTMNAPDGSQIGDAAEVKWDNNVTTPGNATPGTYIYLGDRRYRRGAAF